MSFDVTGRAIYPLSDLIPVADFPLADFIPAEALTNVFAGLYYTEASAYERDGNFVYDVQLVFEGELALAPPGCDAFALVFGSANAGWTAVHLELVIGPDFSVAMTEATVSVRIGDAVLRDVGTGGPAQIGIQGDLIFNAEGISIGNATGASLAPAFLCGTELVVAATDVRAVFGIIDPPGFVTAESFRGLTFEQLAVTIPAEYLNTDPGQDLQLTIDQCVIGTSGFTGQANLTAADPANPVSGLLLGFPFHFRRFGLDIRQNAILDATFGADVRIEALEEGGVPKWIAVDFSFGADGSFSGSLAAVQPAGAAGAGSASLVEREFAEVVRLGLDAVRVTRHEGVWAFFFSGRMKLLLSGNDEWPEVVFDEIGFDSNARFILPDGAGIGFASPMVVDWYFVRLNISKFRFGYADDSGDWLQLGLSAEVMLIDGLPAGASVEGLTVKWQPRGNSPPEVSMEGIGVSFGVPGTFNAGIAVSYSQTDGAIEFRGKGSLELTALDMGIEIGVVIGLQSATAEYPDPFVYLYLFADAKLLPSGIPLGQSGVSIYGFQGLIAYNMALKINQALPADERFYELFSKPPIGITDIDKWEKRYGQNALGVGVVLGTADTGFSLNVKGLLVVAFPDLTILLQARANFIKLKPDLSTQEEGTLDALMVYASGQNTLTLDILAHWEIPVLLSVGGSARAFFSFADPSAWYLEIGRDREGRRVAAQVLYWGGGWLFNAGFWFRLDGHGVVTGAQISFDLRDEAGGFWVKVSGSARGQMALSWQPMQWEGRLEMSGDIRAGFSGVSVGITLTGKARARVRRPFDVHIHVEACVDLFLKTVCKGFNFDWQEIEPPQLESPIRRWAATPRHWTPYESGPAGLDTGVVPLELGTNPQPLPVIQPHSVISLDFAKAMVDATEGFDEAIELNDDGFHTIGKKSDWSAAFRLDQVSLVRRPGASDEAAVTIYGTWACETPERNTTLRLLSSERFAHDGTLSNAFVDGVTLDYCDTPDTTIVCVPLSDLRPGYGRIDDGPLYHWEPGPDGVSSSTGGPVLGDNDKVEVSFPGPVTNVSVSVLPPAKPKPTRKPPKWLAWFCRIPACRLTLLALIAGLVTLLALVLALIVWTPSTALFWVAILGAFIVVLLLALHWLCHCFYTCLGKDTADPDDGKVVTPTTTDGGTTVIIDGDDTGEGSLGQLCWAPGHGTPDWSELRRRGGSVTQYESWTIPAEMRVLPPNELFELRVSYTALLRGPNHDIDTPLGAPREVVARFRTAGPPDWADALANYIAYVHPADGSRPVYTGYDLRVQFLEDYVPYLYAAVGEELMIRLFDGQGNPLLDPDGRPLLVPATEVGPTERSTAQQVWEEIYQENVARGCVSGPPIRKESETVLRLDAATAPLTPNSQYVAQLVSDARPVVPLAAWGFTTARFATFTELVTQGRSLAPPLRVTQALAGADFDTLARAAGVPTIRYAETFTVTPLLDVAGARCVAVLLESPEPLEAGTRLSVTVGGVAAGLHANLDTTRVFLLHPTGDWGATVLSVRLTWRRDPGAGLPKLTVGGVAGNEVVTFDLDAGSQP